MRQSMPCRCTPQRRCCTTRTSSRPPPTPATRSSFCPNSTFNTCSQRPSPLDSTRTFHDYLLRNFNLFRLESAYEIKQNVDDVLQRLNTRVGTNGAPSFEGWAKMALPIVEFKIREVAKARLGETVPAYVTADVIEESPFLKLFLDHLQHHAHTRCEDAKRLGGLSPP